MGWGSVLPCTTLLTSGALGRGGIPVDIVQGGRAKEKGGKGITGVLAGLLEEQLGYPAMGQEVRRWGHIPAVSQGSF